jgi:acetyl esterase/lipase
VGRFFIAAAFLIAQPIVAQPLPPLEAPGPTPTRADIAYVPDGSHGHLLDLYMPRGVKTRMPLVIWTGGSAWLKDNGKDKAGWLVPDLNRAGYAVAGVSIRTSSEVTFPGQLYDIKAAIRWLRHNARHYGFDGSRIAIMGDSSGGWATAMAAVTGDVPELEGDLGTTGVSSAVQAAIAFYPPTKFTEMDDWALRPCRISLFCHDSPESPESLLIGCPIQECPHKAALADPARYISTDDPPIMILHGESDPLVPHEQGERLYQALNKDCHDAIFISLPKAGHGPAQRLLNDNIVREDATIRSTAAEGCKVSLPEPYQPSMATIVGFLDAHLKAKTAPPKRQDETRR